MQAVSLCSGPRGHVRPDPVAWRRLGLHRSRTTHQDKICRSSQDTSFLRFSVMTHMSRHIVVAPILSAPLLTDTRRSTVGPGMREDIACVVGGVLALAPAPVAFAALCSWWSTSRQLLQFRPARCPSGALERMICRRTCLFASWCPGGLGRREPAGTHQVLDDRSNDGREAARTIACWSRWLVSCAGVEHIS